MKFRKKPVVIEAIRWTGENLAEIINHCGGIHPDCSDWSWERYEQLVADKGLYIFTLEGKMSAQIGDWIIRGVAGECYPCKPDIFEATYDFAEE